jgi:hypothetical protein
MACLTSRGIVGGGRVQQELVTQYGKHAVIIKWPCKKLYFTVQKIIYFSECRLHTYKSVQKSDGRAKFIAHSAYT